MLAWYFSFLDVNNFNICQTSSRHCSNHTEGREFSTEQCSNQACEKPEIKTSRRLPCDPSLLIHSSPLRQVGVGAQLPLPCFSPSSFLAAGTKFCMKFCCNLGLFPYQYINEGYLSDNFRTDSCLNSKTKSVI